MENEVQIFNILKKLKIKIQLLIHFLTPFSVKVCDYFI